MKVALFLVDGFEDVEALAPYDLLRRANIDVDLVSVFNKEYVISSHGVTIKAHKYLQDLTILDYQALLYPGGPGVNLYNTSPDLIIKTQQGLESSLVIGMICAAPLFFISNGWLNNNNFTIFPGVIDQVSEYTYSHDKIVVDHNIISAQAVGSSIDFGLKLIEVLQGYNKMLEIKEAIYY